MKISTILILVVVIVLVGLFFLKKDNSSDHPSSPSTATSTQSSNVGTASVSGRIVFAGKPPEMKIIDSSMDAACIKNNGGEMLKSEALVLGPEQALANVLVYIQEPPGQGSLLSNGAMPTEGAVIDQKGCRYIPHVVALQVGQKLSIMNTDAIMHNVHAMATANAEFNEAMTKFTKTKEKIFDKAEIGMKMKCDIHPWMNSIIHVLPHRFFALTGADGKYNISGLPAGTYNLAIWHEKLGAETMVMTVSAGQKVHQDFTLQVPF